MIDPSTIHLNAIPLRLKSADPSHQKWPFGTCEIGQCFSIDDPRQHDNAASSYKYFSKKLGYKFKRKTIGDVMYVWRDE